ncbi:hypothetical protein CXG81DRAFT_19346 [Caulochytrium protostelioides]|uniref:SH3 domain-containing protein n=1 Tax=Caulochytrium protostelioides TaxID=1555241 RepID=A0A4P9X6H1_9FUNG|nr:hypothetical protein CXG81DRAFT_19346 [Caulochytrium protostelioides]|eukprot:RKP00768.1 hypothetical protein CXG81DRAFT_19346 [Caulochytrium protostelioides]
MVPSVAADCLPLRGSSVCGSGFGDYSVDPAAFATLNEQFPVLGLTASSSIADMDKALAALAGASGNSVSPFFTRLGCPTQRDIPGRYMESATCALLISYSGSCPSNPTGRGLAAIAGKNNVVTTANQKVPSVCTTIVEKFNTSVTNYMSASCPSADMDFWKTYITSLTRTIFDDSSCVQGLSEERALCGFSNSPVGNASFKNLCGVEAAATCCPISTNSAVRLVKSAQPLNSGAKKLSTGVIVGIVLGIVAVLLIAVGTWRFLQWDRQRAQHRAKLALDLPHPNHGRRRRPSDSRSEASAATRSTAASDAPLVPRRANTAKTAPGPAPAPKYTDGNIFLAASRSSPTGSETPVGTSRSLPRSLASRGTVRSQRSQRSLRAPRSPSPPLVAPLRRATTRGSVSAGTDGAHPRPSSKLSLKAPPAQVSAFYRQRLNGLADRASLTPSMRSESLRDSVQGGGGGDARGSATANGLTESVLDDDHAYRHVVMPYRAQLPDELELTLGDVVYVLEAFPDGWGTATNLSTGQTGALPLSFLASDPIHRQDRASLGPASAAAAAPGAGDTRDEGRGSASAHPSGERPLTHMTRDSAFDPYAASLYSNDGHGAPDEPVGTHAEALIHRHRESIAALRSSRLGAPAPSAVPAPRPPATSSTFPMPTATRTSLTASEMPLGLPTEANLSRAPPEVRRLYESGEISIREFWALVSRAGSR